MTNDLQSLPSEASRWRRRMRFFLWISVLLLACTKGKERPSACVPADCQQFLDKYFGAWKSKDIATLQPDEFRSHIATEILSGMILTRNWGCYLAVFSVRLPCGGRKCARLYSGSLKKGRHAM